MPHTTHNPNPRERVLGALPGGARATAGGTPSVSAVERAAHVAVGGRAPRLWPWVAGALTLAVGAGAALLLEHFSKVSATLAPGPAAASAVPPQGAHPAADPTLLVWAAAAITLLIAAYFITRYLTASTRDKAPSWHGPA